MAKSHFHERLLRITSLRNVSGIFTVHSIKYISCAFDFTLDILVGEVSLGILESVAIVIYVMLTKLYPVYTQQAIFLLSH